MSNKSVAIVAHHFWDRPGGGELVCAATAYAFHEMNFNTVLTSIFLFDKGKYIEWFGIDLSKYDVITLFRFRLKAFGLYLRLIAWIPVKKAIDKYNPAIIFIDNGIYKSLIKDIKRNKIHLIEYIHFPLEISIDKRFKGTGLYYTEDPYIRERYGRFPLNIYWGIFAEILPHYIRKNPFEVASLVLTNSRWTAELARQAYGERPEILNPPIAPNVEIVANPRSFEERQNAVVMLGRFSEEKRYHWVIEEVMPKLRREIPDVQLYIFGGARTKTSLNYIAKLEDVAKEKEFKVSRYIDQEADIYLVPDAPRKTINMVMDRAKAFLHATINEHWGIAVAEAMARGLPVAVHKSGGTWSDLANEGVYGLGYSDAQEVVNTLSRLLTDEKTWTKYSIKSIERARTLTLERYAEALGSLLAKIV